MRLSSNLCRWRHVRRLLRSWSTAVQLALTVSAAFGVVALAGAEVEFRRDRPDAVQRAAALGNSRYAERLADLDPERARGILREALRADPRAASLWILLGLTEERFAEKSGREERQPEGRSAEKSLSGDHPARKKIVVEESFHDFRLARAAFETAFRVDQQYAPAWALANFCFRRGDQGCFWRAASRAVSRAPSWAAAPSPGYPNLTDLAPLFELASRMDPSPAGVLDRLESGVPGEGHPTRTTSAAGKLLGCILRLPLDTAPGTALASRYATPFTRPFATRVVAYAAPYAAPYATAASVAAPLERAYLDLLIGTSQWEEAEIVARRISSRLIGSETGSRLKPDSALSQRLDRARPDASGRTREGASDAACLDDFVTRLIAAGRAPAAVGLWNEYKGFAALDPARGWSLTNGDFEREPTNAGFDWRLGPGPGAAGDSGRNLFGHVRAVSEGVEPLWTPSQLEFRFTGEEAEQRQLAEQWLPLGPRRYRLSFEYETRSLPSPTGIRWELAAKEPLAEAPSLEPSASWRAALWNFGGDEGLARLRLIYHRVPGTVRARGSFLVRRVRLEVL